MVRKYFVALLMLGIACLIMGSPVLAGDGKAEQKAGESCPKWAGFRSPRAPGPFRLFTRGKASNRCSN